MSTQPSAPQYRIEEYIVKEQPFYMATSDEVEIFEAAYRQRVPVLLKGPTGTGKTRFVEYMAWKLGQPLTIVKDGAKGGEEQHAANGAVPLVTVACHEDLTASDLVGRYLLDANGTRWIDGPLTRAVRVGGICYLDEIVEARKDTTVIIHPLTDHRRLLTIDKLGEVVEAADSFLLVVSYNPGYQNVLKDLKHSTRQRFVALDFQFPEHRARGENYSARIGRRRADRRATGQARPQGAQSARAWLERGREHARVDLRRPLDQGRDRAAPRLPGGGHLGHHRRPASAAQPRRSRQQQYSRENSKERIAAKNAKLAK